MVFEHGGYAVIVNQRLIDDNEKNIVSNTNSFILVFFFPTRLQYCHLT